MLMGFVPACFSYLLDYCLGLPGSENDIHTKEIFFPYTLWLARRRLKQHNLLKAKETFFYAQLNSDDASVRKDAVRMMKVTIVTEGRKFFTWEYMVGMCIFCTGFWIAELTALICLFYGPHLVHFSPALLFIFLPIFSHTILRKF
jgi:hypothetical protein